MSISRSRASHPACDAGLVCTRRTPPAAAATTAEPADSPLQQVQLCAQTALTGITKLLKGSSSARCVTKGSMRRVVAAVLALYVSQARLQHWQARQSVWRALRGSTKAGTVVSAATRVTRVVSAALEQVRAATAASARMRVVPVCLRAVYAWLVRSLRVLVRWLATTACRVCIPLIQAGRYASPALLATSA